MEDTSSLHLKTTSGLVSCKLQPLVIFNILDHYTRRSEGHRVIGALVGVNNEGVVELRNSFPVPHAEATPEQGGQVGVQPNFFKTMLKLHQQISPKEVVLGWYSTGNEIDQSSALFHDFFAKEMGHHSTPIFLTVDTSLTDFQMSIKAHVSHPVSLGSDTKELGFQFLPAPLEIQTFDEEKVALNALNKSNSKQGNAITSDLDNLEISVSKVQELLESVTGYVNTVLEGKITPDTNVGRFLADSLASLPKLDPSSLEKMFTNNLQDLLLVVYLANLTRTQLALAEKLQKVV